MKRIDIKTSYHNFFEKNLFERIIIYVCLSDLLVKIIFELGLGQNSFFQPQHKQWFYFSFLALDYLLSFRKTVNIRVTVNPMSLLAFVFFIMTAHGLFMGVMLHNAPFVIFNDLVPIVVIALNMLRMQSFTEYKPVDMKSLFFICTSLVVATSVVGLFTEPSIAGQTMYLPLLFAALFTLKPFPKWYALIGATVIAMNTYDINRTTMAFAAFVALIYIVVHLFKNPYKAIITSIVVAMTLVVAVTFVSEDTKTYRRVVGLTQIDLQASKGSIGERQEEWRAINKKLEKQGPTVKILGLGFGGVYEVERTHGYLKDYGHAHYSWAWFNLRYGRSGFVYLFILMSALLYNGIHWGRRYDDFLSVYISMLCFLSLVYCATYVNAVFLMLGIQFIRNIKLLDDKITDE